MKRREQTKLHVYVDHEIKKQIKLIALKKDSSIQELLEQYVFELLEQEKSNFNI